MESIVQGVVKDGLVVPEAPLPEGACVEIRIVPLEMPPELQEEFDAWNRASDHALEAFERMLEGEKPDEPR
jgi:hypothetical protein